MFDLFDFKNTTPSWNFGSNARGGVLEYVDHCFGTLWVPYLSLIFLLRYIVSSPLFLVIYGSELKSAQHLFHLLYLLLSSFRRIDGPTFYISLFRIFNYRHGCRKSC